MGPMNATQRLAECWSRWKEARGDCLTTDTKEKPVDVFKVYTYQPRIEKRHALLKSTLEVAPI